MQIEANNNVDLKLPSKSRFPKLFRKTRFGRWIGRVQARFTIRIQGLKDKFNKFFGRISSIVNRGFKVLKSAASIAVSGRYPVFSFLTLCLKFYALRVYVNL